MESILENELEDETPFDFLSEDDKEFVKTIVLSTIQFSEELSGMTLRPYQRQFAYRIVESVVLADGEETTALWARQSGKSQTLAIVVAGMMVLFPKLSKSFSMFERFERGLWVGMYAPVDSQSELIYQKVMEILQSERGKELLQDPEIDEKVTAGAKLARLKSGSLLRRQTANPKAKIEGASYHLIVLDEAQDADDTMVRKSIHPMAAAYAGSIVKIGTPSFHTGDFYKAIQSNKRRQLTRGAVQRHFEYDWKTVAKYNPYYKKFIEQQKINPGEESDEFQMSYCLKWQIDRGMLVTEEELDYLADKSMSIVPQWVRTPVVVGIDPARIKDSTVVTVVWVDWDNPDASGYRRHAVLDWLEIQNTEWEDQYYKIVEFLDNYDVIMIGVDAQGMGGPIAERLGRLMGHRCTVVPLTSDLKNQSDRWKHLIQLLQRRMITYPGHSSARRLTRWKKFRLQMEQAAKVMRGSYMLIEGPQNTRDAHDDYVDSLALACYMTIEAAVPEAEQSTAPWY